MFILHHSLKFNVNDLTQCKDRIYAQLFSDDVQIQLTVKVVKENPSHWIIWKLTVKYYLIIIDNLHVVCKVCFHRRI